MKNILMPVDRVKSISYKNHWLGISLPFTVFTIAGLAAGTAIDFIIFDIFDIGKNIRNPEAAIVVGLSSGIIGGITGIILGWLWGYNYVYQFNQ